MNAPTAVIDFESRSECSLSASGAWRYAQDRTTEVLCLAYRLPHWTLGRTELYHPAFPHLGVVGTADPTDLFNWIHDGGLVEAHNAFFERALWTVRCFCWPQIHPHQWRDSAAKAAAHALPRGLDKALAARGLSITKDAEGEKIMKQMAQPRKPVKADWIAWNRQHGPCGMCGGVGRVDQWKLDGAPTVKGVRCVRCGGTGAQPGAEAPPMPTLWHESREMLEQLFAYCRQDVLAEEALSASLPDLSPDETGIFILDQVVNERGFQLDMDAVDAALTLIDGECVELNAELRELTGGAVEKATQRARMLVWLAEQGLDLPNTQGTTVDDTLTRGDLTPPARRGLELMRTLGRSSTAKYEAMQDWACEDGRVRGGLLYHGATTGRWPITGDHECLTPTGWVRMDKWPGGDIACWEPSGAMRFASATRIEASLLPGERLAHWKNQKIDQLSTGDHAMPAFVRRRESAVSGRVWGGEFRRKQMGAVAAGDRIPLCGVMPPVASPFTDLQTRILMMAQADGHYVTEKSKGRCLKFGFRKERKIRRCRDLLILAGIPHTVFADGKNVRFRVPQNTMPEWLWAFNNKTFDWTWLHIDTEVFFDELVRWDGSVSSPKGFEYTSTNKQNVDIVQALAHLSGRTCGMRCLQRDGWSDAWRCCIDKNPAPVTFRTPQLTYEIPESPSVYCAQTSTGYFLVRRNGRAWITGNSGKGPQIQNLPKPVLGKVSQDDLWDVLLTRDASQVRAKYGNVMEALSHGLRGAITATPGKQLYVADFAGIEARVLLWAAGDDRPLDVFRNHQDIYCEMAEEIYKYPVNKTDHPKERGIGKIACFGAETLVLTTRGWIPINTVTPADRVWDGIEWVNHDGLADQGVREVVSWHGIEVTPDHLVWVGHDWCPVRNVDTILLQSALDSANSSWLGCEWENAGALPLCVFGVPAAQRFTMSRSPISARVQLRGAMRARKQKLKTLVRKSIGVMQTFFQMLRTGLGCLTASALSSRDARTHETRITQPTGGEGFEFTLIGFKDIEARVGVLKQKDDDRFYSISLPFRDGMTRLSTWTAEIMTKDTCLAIFDSLPEQPMAEISAKSGKCKPDSRNWKRVYDLVNAGPRQRFMVLTGRGPLIVHNCLALGYQMGASKFTETCALGGVDIPEDHYCAECGKGTREHRREHHTFEYEPDIDPDAITAVKVVTAYREKFWRVRDMWTDQEAAAIAAVQLDDVVPCGVVEWRVEDDFLYCVLPSGRRLAYPFPQIRPTTTSWGAVRDQLTFMGEDTYTHQWKRQTTYGGMLVENIVQSVARDILAASLLRCERSGTYVPVLTVHDEVVAEAPLGVGSVEEFGQLIAATPDWASGCPVETESFVCTRYRK